MGSKKKQETPKKPRISIPPSLQTVTNISDIYIAWYHALINVKHLMCLSIVNHKMYEKKYSGDAPFSLWKGSLTKKKRWTNGLSHKLTWASTIRYFHTRLASCHFHGQGLVGIPLSSTHLEKDSFHPHSWVLCLKYLDFRTKWSSGRFGQSWPLLWLFLIHIPSKS